MIAELHQIDPAHYDLQRAEWLWDRLKEQRACFDDYSKDRGDLFAQRFLSPNTLAFEYADSGLIMIENILPRHSAEIHFFLWDKTIRETAAAKVGREIIREAFDVYKLHRISTMHPDFNRFAERVCTFCGFRYEGTARQSWQHNGRFFDTKIYGLLAHEFEMVRVN